MGYPTPIEWTDATWNPFGGCSVVSPGCTNCYAMRIAGSGRLRNHPLYAGVTTESKAGPVFNGRLTAAAADADVWSWPLRWRGAKEPKLGAGKPSMIFVGDMADLFHENRPLEVIDRVFAVAVLASHHIFQKLTKRPERLRDYLTSYDLARADSRGQAVIDLARKSLPARLPLDFGSFGWPPRNIWFGFSAEDQPRFDERWLFMRDVAALGCTIFVSVEPALGRVVLPADFLALGRRAQVIVGGESGPTARPMHPDWARSLRDQCAAGGVPFFFKQWGEWHPHDRGIYYAGPSRPKGEFPQKFVHLSATRAKASADACYMLRVGKKAAGAMLDGREHREFPA